MILFLVFVKIISLEDYLGVYKVMSPEMLASLEEGLTVLAIGFSTVFVFLVIMIIAMNIQTVVIRYLNKVFPVAVPETATPKAIRTSDDTEIAIAIACATLKQNHG